MSYDSIAAESRFAEEQRVYRTEKRAANILFLKSFASMLFLLALAVTVATVLAMQFR